MNKLMIIGNLTRDPEQRVTQAGKTVTSFTLAVNRRGQDNAADFFRVTCWDKLAETAAQYLSRGRKVCVMGPVSASTYQAQDGTTRVSLEVTAHEVEFLSARGETAQAEKPADNQGGYTRVETDELPF